METLERCEAEQAVGDTPLRRLTYQQYRNTVVDLFGTGVFTSDSNQQLRDIPDGSAGRFAVSAEAPSSEILRAYLSAAEFLAESIPNERLGEFGTCANADCARTHLPSLIRRVFRRAPDADDLERYVTLFASVRADASAVITRQVIVAALLASPNFLYRAEPLAEAWDERRIGVDPYAVASRLSYFLWNGPPDEALLQAAESGALADEEALAAEVERMAGDDKFHRGLRNFFDQWLELDALADAEDPEVADLYDSMREESLLFAETLLLAGDGLLATLLTADYTYGDEAVAELYGAPAPDATGRIQLDASERAGILTQAAFLARTHSAHPEIHRGLWVRANLLCDSPPPPPEDIPEAGAQYRLETEPCVGCHRRMDLIGFGFDAYDELGRYQAPEDDPERVPYVEAGGLSEELAGSFTDARELADRIATSPDVADCMTLQWVRFGHGRAETPDDECDVTDLQQRMREGGGDIRALLRGVALSDTLRVRSATARIPSDEEEGEL